MRVGYKGASEVLMDRDEVECFLANMIYKVCLVAFLSLHVLLWRLLRLHVLFVSGALYVKMLRKTVVAWVNGLAAWPPRPRLDTSSLQPYPCMNDRTKEENADETLLVLPQNMMKGYIARDRGVVVLSKAGAFPGTGV